MKKTPVLVAGALLATTLVAGCGGSNGYCDTIKADAATLTDFTSPTVRPDFAKIPAFLADAKKLQAKAPDEVKKDWTTVVTNLQSLSDELKSIGMTFPQFADFLNTGVLPKGITQARTAGLAMKYQQLGSDTVTKASNDITVHAGAACKVDLTKKS